MGPVVTMYEFAPAPGTRTGKIANLEKDLAMALEAQAVRIVAPIPGKAVVGIEVPNKTREMVYLKEILQDDCFTEGDLEAAARARQGHRGRAGQREPVEDAAPAGRRHHRLGQVGRGQRHDHQPALQRDARRRPLHHGRPEDAGALDLRGHPAPAAAGGHRPEEGEPGAALGGRRDGAALRAARQDRRARHRQLQRQGRGRTAARRTRPAAPRRARQATRRSSVVHRRARRHRAGGRARRRRRDHAAPRRGRGDSGGIVSSRRRATRIVRRGGRGPGRQEKAAAAEPRPPSCPTSSSSSTSSPTS